MTSVVCADGKLFARSLGGAIKIWDLEGAGECLHTFKGSSGLGSLNYTNEFLTSLTYAEIQIWDIHKGVCLVTLAEELNDVCSHAFANEKLFLGFNDGSIQVWDFNNITADYSGMRFLRSRESV